MNVSTLTTTGASDAEVASQLADELEKFNAWVTGERDIPDTDFTARSVSQNALNLKPGR